MSGPTESTRLQTATVDKLSASNSSGAQRDEIRGVAAAAAAASYQACSHHQDGYLSPHVQDEFEPRDELVESLVDEGSESNKRDRVGFSLKTIAICLAYLFTVSKATGLLFFND